MTLVTGIDIETTGLEQEKGHRIIEVAMICYELETRAPRVSFVQRINPERSIAPAAQAIHHISIDDLAGCPTWEKVAPKVQMILRKTHLAVAHNGDHFDMPFIALELMRAGLEVPNVSTFDTMLKGRWATLNGKVPNLGELCHACDVDYDTGAGSAHAADYDVRVMMESFWFGLDHGFFAPPELADLVERKAA